MRVEIAPKDPRHEKLIKLAKACFDLSEKYMKQRRPKWEKCEKMDRSFIDVSETDAKGKKKNPFERQIYIPMSRACKDTMLSYWMQVFCGKRPMFPIEGRSPEDVRTAKLNEVLLDYQCERQRMPLVIYGFLNDVAKYSCGSIKNLFIRQYQPLFKPVQRLQVLPVPHYTTVREKTNALAYEGPEFTNNDPYKFFPDPRVPLGKAKNGQFQGFEYGRSLYYLKKRAADGTYYNIDELKDLASEPETDGDSDERNRIMGISTPGTYEDLSLDKKNPHYKLRELWVEVIPKDYGLTSSSYPEIWILTMVNNRVLIRSEKAIYAHGGFPNVIGEYDYDGYSLFTQSFYEGQEGLQDLLNWLYNSHMDNVRRFLNDMLVVDPKAVHIRDITKPSAAKIIRLKTELWKKGISIDSVIKQLRVNDVTASHVKDGLLISNMMQRRAHTPDAMQGIETEIKRTATEITKMTAGGSNILGTWAILLYAQALIPLAEMTVMNNQQLLSEERFYRIVGDYAKYLQTDPDPRVPGMAGTMIGPNDIQGFFDFPIDDGRLPVRATDNAKVWSQVFKVIASTPPVQGEIDIFAVFKEFAQSLGVKNIEQFRLKAKVLPDPEVARAEEAGDIVSLGDYLGYTPDARKAA